MTPRATATFLAGVVAIGAAFVGAVIGAEVLLVGADLRAPVTVAVLVGAVLVIGGRTITGHAHDGPRHHVARHEAGHVVAARAVGGRVRSGWVRGSGSSAYGSVMATVPSARAELVFLAAGRHAAPGAGCASDDRAVARTLREFPASERDKVRRDVDRTAARIVASRAGELDRVARRLDAGKRP